MHNAAICSPICINQFDGARFMYAARVHFRSTDWRLSDTRPNASRDLWRR